MVFLLLILLFFTLSRTSCRCCFDWSLCSFAFILSSSICLCLRASSSNFYISCGLHAQYLCGGAIGSFLSDQVPLVYLEGSFQDLGSLCWCRDSERIHFDACDRCGFCFVDVHCIFQQFRWIQGLLDRCWLDFGKGVLLTFLGFLLNFIERLYFINFICWFTQQGI